MEATRRRQEEIVFAKGEARRLGCQFTDAKARNASVEDLTKLGELVSEADEFVKALEIVQQQPIGDTVQMRFRTFKTTFAKLRLVQTVIVKLVSALREELNLPRNDDEFMEKFKDMEQRAWNAVNIVYGGDPPLQMPDIIEPI